MGRPTGAGASDRLIAITLTLVPFTALGLARFAYGLVLPAMRAELSWSYFEAGVVTTMNAAGYLVGAALGAAAARRFGAWEMIVGGVAGMAVSLAATAPLSAMAPILFFRFGAGIFGGLAFVAGGTLAAQLSKTSVRSALVWYPAGAGLAIVVSAGGQALIDALGGGWRVGWFALGALGAIAALLLAMIVPRGGEGQPVQRAGSAARVKGLELSYGLFGLGYISYVTFVGAYVDDGDATLDPRLFWAVLGTASVVGAFAWPPLFARHTAGAMYPVTLALCSLGVLAILVDRSAPGALASAGLFGFSFLAVVSGVTGAARDRVVPEGWAKAIGSLTVTFGAGQTIGPLLGGALGDTSSGLRLGLGASVVILATGAVVALVDSRSVSSGAVGPY